MMLTESLIVLKAYAMLSIAVLNGGSLESATAQYYQADCITRTLDVAKCDRITNSGIKAGMFPIDLSSSPNPRIYPFSG